MGHIFFILWVSGAWKGTLLKNLKNTYSDFHIPLSYKTRTIRKTEINHIDAHFISREDFFASVQDEEFLEYALVHELDYYGTKYEDVIENGINKWKIVIKELDILWLNKLKKQRPEFDERYTTIFLNIPEDILRIRIESRWALMSNEELEKRINSVVMEETKAREICDFIIDATKNETEVLNEALEIIRNKTWKSI